MRPLNVFDYLIGAVSAPFESFHPFAGLTAVCLLITVFGATVYRAVTDQKLLRGIQSQVKLRLIELRIRHLSAGDAFKLQMEAMGWNFRYLRAAFLPGLIVLVPIALMLPAIDARYAYQPARAGVVVSLEAEIRPDAPATGGNADFVLPQFAPSVIVPRGLEMVDSGTRPSAMIPGGTVADWYFVPSKTGVYEVQLFHRGGRISRQIVVSDGTAPLSPVTKTDEKAGFMDRFAGAVYNPEPGAAIPPGIGIDSVSVGYRALSSPISFFGWRPDWIWWFMIYFLLAFVALKPVMKVH